MSTTKKLSEKLGHWSLDHYHYSGDELAAEARALEEHMAELEKRDIAWAKTVEAGDYLLREATARVAELERQHVMAQDPWDALTARAEAAEAERDALREIGEASYATGAKLYQQGYAEGYGNADALRAKLEDVRTYVEVYAVLGAHGDNILAILDGEGDDE